MWCPNLKYQLSWIYGNKAVLTFVFCFKFCGQMNVHASGLSQAHKWRHKCWKLTLTPRISKILMNLQIEHFQISAELLPFLYGQDLGPRHIDATTKYIIWGPKQSNNLAPPKPIFLKVFRSIRLDDLLTTECQSFQNYGSRIKLAQINPYPTAFPYGNGMVLHFYRQQESSTTKTVHKVINKRLKTYV